MSSMVAMIQFSITATHIYSYKKAGLAWTTTAHAGEKVPVYAMGSGAQMFVTGNLMIRMSQFAWEKPWALMER